MYTLSYTLENRTNLIHRAKKPIQQFQKMFQRHMSSLVSKQIRTHNAKKGKKTVAVQQEIEK